MITGGSKMEKFLVNAIQDFAGMAKMPCVITVCLYNLMILVTTLSMSSSIYPIMPISGNYLPPNLRPPDLLAYHHSNHYPTKLKIHVQMVNTHLGPKEFVPLANRRQ